MALLMEVTGSIKSYIQLYLSKKERVLWVRWNIDANIQPEGTDELPYKLKNDVIYTVSTNIRKFSFRIKAGYLFDGATIPPLFQPFVGHPGEIEFLVASLIHDYLLQHKVEFLKTVIKTPMTMDSFRLITSLIFRRALIEKKVPVKKADVMALAVQVWQSTANNHQW